MINGSELFLVLTVGVIGMLVFTPTHAMPVADQQQSVESAEVPAPNPGLRSDFDYSRFFFQPEAGQKRAVQQHPASFGDRFLGQWYQAGTLPRQLAPKFKREFEAFLPNDKRLDDQYMDDFYMNLKPGRFEWNYNRL